MFQRTRVNLFKSTEVLDELRDEADRLLRAIARNKEEASRVLNLTRVTIVLTCILPKLRTVGGKAAFRERVQAK